jgi:hypothetical protein
MSSGSSRYSSSAKRVIASLKTWILIDVQGRDSRVAGRVWGGEVA